MTLRHGGRDVSVTELAQLLPEAAPKVVVLVHGLCESERSWTCSGRPTTARPMPRDCRRTLATRRCTFASTPACTCPRTALALPRCWRPSWPTGRWSHGVRAGGPFDRRPDRAQCLPPGSALGHRWVGRVRHVFCLGTPHMGAPAEKAANAAALGARQLGETRPMARILEMRSSGIRTCLRLARGGGWRDVDPGRSRTAAPTCRCSRAPTIT